jgi:hypothetical protein
MAPNLTKVVVTKDGEAISYLGFWEDTVDGVTKTGTVSRSHPSYDHEKTDAELEAIATAELNDIIEQE